MAGLINYVKKAFKNYPNTTTKISAENLNHLDNGIFDLDQAVKSAIDDINDDIDGLNNDLTDKVSGFTETTYSAVTGLAYDSTNKKLGLKVGADTVIPFSGGGAKLVGTKYSDGTFNVSTYGATSASQFIAVCSSSKSADGQVHALQACYVTCYAHYTPPSLSLSGNTLSVTCGKVRAYSNGISGQAGGFDSTSTLSTKVYFVGDIT